MARRGKASEQESEWMPTAEDSLLLRSAESLGRVIGSLQRELDNATRQLFNRDGNSRRNGNGKGTKAGQGTTVRRRATKTVKAAAASKTASARKAAKKPAARRAAERKK